MTDPAWKNLRQQMLTLGLLFASPLAAQNAAFPTTPRFAAIVRLAQDGHGDSARASIARELGALDPAAALLPEALYTAGTVATSGEDARLYFARVAVEHPRSAWADKALLRLAQLDYGRGDPASSVVRIERLMADYPTSDVLADAALWGARAALAADNAPQACTWLDRGLRVVGDDVELRNQIEYTRQRCRAGSPGVVTTTVVDSLRAKPPVVRTPEVRPVEPPAVNPPADTVVGPWRVQVAALTDPAAIRRTERAILDAGLRVYRVPGPNGLTKMQAGPFATREDAAGRVAELGRAVGSKPFVVRAP